MVEQSFFKFFTRQREKHKSRCLPDGDNKKGFFYLVAFFTTKGRLAVNWGLESTKFWDQEFFPIGLRFAFNQIIFQPVLRKTNEIHPGNSEKRIQSYRSLTQSQSKPRTVKNNLLFCIKYLHVQYMMYYMSCRFNFIRATVTVHFQDHFMESLNYINDINLEF